MSSLLKLSFLDLDSLSQLDDLLREWDRLNSPDFLPVLQILARLKVAKDAAGAGSLLELKGLALKRWYELDPEGARREVLAQIGSASPSLTGDSLAFLPEEQLPQFEPLWAQALLETTNPDLEKTLGSLLIRFGTGAATDQMIAKLDKEEALPCGESYEALAYLARFRPDVARLRLRHETKTNQVDCVLAPLQFEAELTTAPCLNELAVENLNSPTPQTVLDAIEYLTSYGRKEDEEPLWRRYVEWTTAYKGKAALLDRSKAHWDRTFASSNMGAGLGSALIQGQGWFADADLISRVLKGCVGKEMCQELKRVAREANLPYDVGLAGITTPLGGLT